MMNSKTEINEAIEMHGIWSTSRLKIFQSRRIKKDGKRAEIYSPDYLCFMLFVL